MEQVATENQSILTILGVEVPLIAKGSPNAHRGKVWRRRGAGYGTIRVEHYAWSDGQRVSWRIKRTFTVTATTPSQDHVHDGLPLNIHRSAQTVTFGNGTSFEEALAAFMLSEAELTESAKVSMKFRGHADWDRMAGELERDPISRLRAELHTEPLTPASTRVNTQHEPADG